MKRGAIIVAAGKGLRFGSDIPKAFIELGGESLLLHSARIFADLNIEHLVAAIPEGWADVAERILSPFGPNYRFVFGGSTRTESVKLAFAVLDNDVETIAIHDTARPLLDPIDASRTFDAAEIHGAATLGVPISDTLKSVSEGFVENTIPRFGLFAVQTPQVFNRSLFKRALRSAPHDCTDDCALVEALGEKIYLVVGKRCNIKITYPEDLALAESLLKIKKADL